MLTELACKNFEPQEKSYKKFDGGGMFLLIKPDGSKYWRLKYNYAGKEKLIALGVYPTVSLKEARIKRDECKVKISNGEDPVQLKKQAKHELKENVANTFENVTLEWHKKKWGESTSKNAKLELSRLTRNIFPDLGAIPIKKITAQQLINTIRKIEERGVLTEAKKTRGLVGQVFRYAIATKKAEHNLITDTKGAYKQPEEKHHPHFSEKELKEFLKNFDNFKGTPIIKLALKFLILTFVRSGELRGARWEEFDFEKSEWRIPAERMKMKEQHIVPLSKQALELLKEIKKLSFSENETGLLFPGVIRSKKPISDNTLSKALRDQGYQGKATPHGMRATASTILNENGFKPDVIERQLAHCERNKVRASYNHAQYLQERREMMNWWGDFVEKLEGK